jgi:hypothetical protein
LQIAPFRRKETLPARCPLQPKMPPENALL